MLVSMGSDEHLSNTAYQVAAICVILAKRLSARPGSVMMGGYSPGVSEM